METGLIDITGQAPAGSAVQLFDGNGASLGTVTAGVTRGFAITGLELAPGEHRIRAVATRRDGEVFESDEITVEVKASSDVDAALADESGYVESSLTPDEEFELASLKRERREQANEVYTQLVQAVVDGVDVDPFEGESIIAAAGKTVDEFSSDVFSVIRLEAQLELLRATSRMRLLSADAAPVTRLAW